MNVTVRLFASYAEGLGRNDVVLELPTGSTAGSVVNSIRSFPGGSSLPPAPLIAVNHEYAKPDQVLEQGDEVALIPPVAGG